MPSVLLLHMYDQLTDGLVCQGAKGIKLLQGDKLFCSELLYR